MSKQFKISFVIVLFLSLGMSPLFAQKKGKKSKEEGMIEQAKDDVFALTKEDFPYIERFYEALRLKMSGNRAEAKSLLKQCLVEKPNDDAVLYALSMISSDEGMNNQALDYLLKAKKADPENMHYVLAVAQAQFEKAEFEKSAANYKIVVENEPRNAELIYSYAQALVFSRNYLEAINAFNSVEDLMGTIPEITFTKLDLLQQIGKTEQIDAELLKLRNTYPSDKALLSKIVLFYQERGEQEKLVAMLEQEVKESPNNISVQLMLAEHYVRTNQTEKFGQTFSVLINDPLASAFAKANLLETATTMKAVNKELLVAEALKLEKTAEDNPELQLTLARTLIQNGEIFTGIKNYRAALKTNTNNYEEWRKLLTLEIQYGYYKLLLEDAKMALELYPSFPEMYAFSALAHLHNGDKATCKEQLEIGEEFILSDESGSLKATFYMIKGRLAYAKKDYKLGNEMYQKAVNATDLKDGFMIDWCMQNAIANIAISTSISKLEKIPEAGKNSLAYKFTNARLQFRLEEYEKSSSFLTEILKQAPNFANAIDLHGDVIFKQGKVEKAVEKWQRAKELNTSNKNINKKIETRKIHEPVFY